MVLLEEIDVPAMPMNGLEDLVNDPHLVTTGFFRMEDHPTEGRTRVIASPVRFGSEKRAAAPAPRCGEHGVSVLMEAGLTQEEIESLIAARALFLPTE